MKRVLIFAAVGEASTGVALLIIPSLVGELLFGVALTGIAIPVARVAGIALIALGVACWPGTPLAGSRPARDPDGALDSGIDKRQGDENIEK